MQISDKQGENEQLVKHIRQTSSLASRSTVFDAQRVHQLAKIAARAPEMHLKIMSSGKLKGQVLKINAQGLEGSLRGRLDGYTFFGCKKHDVKKSAAASSGCPR